MIYTYGHDKLLYNYESITRRILGEKSRGERLGNHTYIIHEADIEEVHWTCLVSCVGYNKRLGI